MALVIVDNSQTNQTPTLADTIKFILTTPDSTGCLTQTPYKVINVTIYFISRDFVNGNFYEYNQKYYDPIKLQAAVEAAQIACEYPTEINIENAQNLQKQADSTVITTPFYYNEAIPVESFGDDLDPAWLDPSRSYVNPENNILNNTGTGVFELSWEPSGMREGQYYICWKWQPNPSGDSVSNYFYFEIDAATQLTVLPQQSTDPTKYYALLTRYLPDMFKKRVASSDLSPGVLDAFNKAVASGFGVIEDLVNQTINLLDANYLNEAFLPLLGNMFNLKLKSQDPTLWRRQIKRAIPLFKKKGTLAGLTEAYAEAGFNLLKITKLWQVVSSSTWAEALNVDVTGQTQFVLSRNPILQGDQVDPDNFELYYRPLGQLLPSGYWSTDFSDNLIPESDYVSFSVSGQETIMTWLGPTLNQGDTFKLIYLVKAVEDQTIENYIRGLQLSDQRDDRDQEYPLKNWNVRVIEEDDPMIDVIIPIRHPFENPVIFGQIRTEFPLSENLYNMDEYDGSLRDSKKPCDIDKNFLDCCTACLSSKFNIDLEIKDISDDRLLEAYDILEEYKPFHSILHSMRFSALVDEFVNCNSESLESLVTVAGEERILADVGQIFSRVMQHAHSPGDDQNAIRRNMLNNLNAEATSISGTVSSREVVLYAPNVDLLKLGINNWNYTQNPSSYIPGTNQNILEILSPSVNAGIYVLSGEIGRHVAKIDNATDSFNSSEFTFRISNFIYNNAVCTINEQGLVTVADDISGLLKIGDYLIVDSNPNQYQVTGFGDVGQFYIAYSGPSLGASITIYRRLTENQIGYMNYNGLKLIIPGNYEASLGIINGASAPNYPFPRGFLNEGSGRLDDTDDDHFKENFMLRVDADYTHYFEIEDINGNSPVGHTTFILGGKNQTWPIAGIPATVSIYRATKQSFQVPEQEHLKEVVISNTVDPVSNEVLYQTATQSTWTWPPFDYTAPIGGGSPTTGIDRRGKDLVQQETAMSMGFRTSVLNALNKNQIVDSVSQQESVSFNIEWADDAQKEKND